MKMIAPLTVLLLVMLAGCQKQSANLPGDKNTLETLDSIAAVQMSSELTSMSTVLESLLSGTNHAHQQHWDNLYHQHDSVFWHHHNQYHHETYTHDDHYHQWVPYNTTISHTGHFHHAYPSHANDSLVTNANIHHLNVVNHPFNGHHIRQHHTLDSLHHLHNSHHH